MRYAILSDIHGNLEALQAVLAGIAALGADTVVCLGDLVGYNANPNECVDIIRHDGITCIMGNHDAVACGLEDPGSFNPAAKESVLWTREQLTHENRSFLRELPRELTIGDFFICHGSVHDTNRYILAKGDAQDNFSLMDMLPTRPTVCFFGHTHEQTSYSIEGPLIAYELGESIRIESGKRYLVNPGAVGQPRDGDPRAAFLIYDAKVRNVTFHRTEYDIATSQTSIIRAGLPVRLAQRLSLGR
jgi:diadenosine tetraphosphatase ApaH/serine/threonine PP2A family protein phosphatase